MKKFQVVFISNPEIGALVPTVEFAQRLTDRDRRLSATILIITVSQRPIINAYIQSRVSTSSGHTIKFVHLPTADPPPPDQYQSSLGGLSLLIEKHKPHVRQAITELMQADSHSARVAGLFIDLFCTSMIDVANELGIHCYLFFTSPASCLGFMLHLPTLETQLATEFTDSNTGLIVPKDSVTELIVPSFINPLPPKVLPTVVLKRKRDGYSWFLHHARRYMETKGIVVNTFPELEPHAVRSVCELFPPVYPVGPILDLAGPAQWHPDRGQHEAIMKWLDDQPASSVVFLCFGSMGCLGGAQLREIAVGLERARFRFLWAVREPPKMKLEFPGEYKSVKEILPDGFLDRTSGIGLVCGWVPQVTVLAHRAIGGFVSHCGWNSILESLWYRVPIATWPLYAEQQMNAFQLVKELGLAVEIRLDYRDSNDLVLAEEIERGIRNLMDGVDEVRGKVKKMGDKSRLAVTENGSSDIALASLIEKLLGGI